MNTMRTTWIALAGAALLGGCHLYTGGDDDGGCDYANGGADIAYYQLRNPETGQCEEFGGGGGGTGCNDIDYGGAPADRAPDPDWAQCFSQCDGLDEQTCLAAGGCRAAYVSDCPPLADCTEVNYTYYGCWATAPSGPIQGGGCEDLDAYQCSQHDDCVARHSSQEVYPGDPQGGREPGLTQALGPFESCAAEPGDAPEGCYPGDDCGAGMHCNAEEVCLPAPECGGGGPTPEGDEAEPVPCPCYGYCVPDGDPDPGSCYEPVICTALPPDCPADTVPGRSDGCWTGYCIPIAECEEGPACSELGEIMCVARPDCSSLYEGVGCSCDGDACTCDEWVFDACEEV